MFAMLLEMTSTFSCCAAIPVVAMLKDCMLVSLRRRRAPVFRFGIAGQWPRRPVRRSEEHTSELQSLMRISYAVFCLKKKNKNTHSQINTNHEHTHTHH